MDIAVCYFQKRTRTDTRADRQLILTRILFNSCLSVKYRHVNFFAIIIYLSFLMSIGKLQEKKFQSELFVKRVNG